MNSRFALKVKPSSLYRPVRRPSPMPRPEDLIRAREAAGDRIAFGLGSALTLSVAALVLYGIQTGTSTSRVDLPKVLPAAIDNLPVNRSLAIARHRAEDLDPTTTGSIRAQAQAPEKTRPAPQAASRPAGLVARSYVVWQVNNGIALVEGPDGLREVTVGSALPGAGQVLSIERTGTGWRIVTTETVINTPVL